MAMFTEAWGAGLNVQDIDRTRIDAYCGKRRRLEVVAPVFRVGENGKRQRGYRELRPVRDGALHSELSWFRTVLNWATGFRLEGRRLLTENPPRGRDWPKEKKPAAPGGLA